jgi:hypothetical protein
MGDVGCVTAGRIAEQAARLGITDSLVTVIAGRAYADVVSAVWPHAGRALDGCTTYGNQRARMGHIVRGSWSPEVPVGATAVPALCGTELVAPTDVTPVAAGDLVRGDDLAPGTFGAQHTDAVLVTASGRPVDQPGGRRRVSPIVRPLPLARAQPTPDRLGRCRCRCRRRGRRHRPRHRQRLDSPAGRGRRDPARARSELAAAAHRHRAARRRCLRPGRIRPVEPHRHDHRGHRPGLLRHCRRCAATTSATGVNLRRGPGPVRHGALRADSYVAVLEADRIGRSDGPAPGWLDSPAGPTDSGQKFAADRWLAAWVTSA